jgi:heme exporter protein B
VGTLFAAMSNNMRLRELLLPLLLLPLILPAVLSCVASTAAVLAQNQGEKLYIHLQMLGVYTLVFAVLSFLLFEYVIEE